MKKMPASLTSKQKEQCFIKLFNACRQEGRYLVQEAAQAINMPLELFEQWAQDDERFREALNFAKMIVSTKAEKDALTKKIPAGQGYQSLLQHDTFLKQLYDTDPTTRQEINAEIEDWKAQQKSVI
jgi:hypothetical protein